ncbi:hypothetical protein E3P86_00935 [Wallemia ichthyophaga]|uniref:methylmalonate-semialdehyde dehydrogenase (CoA acylating) n=1 Tax=Wallemia ichthyophaga TaxID=245174 RepID=A0A4T0JBK1_WALIC|nr:hypothetical protein E3P86_00935 [Wallemia ichthyophaga]
MVNPLKISLAPYIKGGLRKSLEPIAKGYLNLAGFKQVGLRYDDLIQEENDQMQKVLGRLSPREEYDRVWRLRRAINQSIQHKDLPAEQWSEEDSSQQRYLTDRIVQVTNEKKDWLALSCDRLPNFINGKFIQSNTHNFHPVTDPSTNKVLSLTPESTHDEITSSINTSFTAFNQWKSSSVLSRQKFVLNFQHQIRLHFDDLAIAVAFENGKTFNDAKGDVLRGLQVVDYAASIPTTLMGSFLQVSDHIDTHTRKLPLGVCIMIAPNNFPSMIPNWSLPLAIATGNSLILKPSQRTPTASLLLAELASISGLPDGVLNVINGTNNVVDSLITHDHVKAVSFVGSDHAGKHVYEKATQHSKRAQVNMGAKNHAVVLPDAVKDASINSILGAAFGAAGQRCMALSVAILVGDSRKWLPDIIEKASDFKVGNGFDHTTDVGPVISPESKSRVLSLIKQSREQGANVLLDGSNVSVKGFEDGNFVGPTIISIPSTQLDIYKTEVFGPVLLLLEAETLDEAVQIINKNKYGNGASIFTESGSAARLFESKVEPGQIGINIPLPVPLPFFSWSGNKASFAGENSFYGEQGVNFYTQTKTTTSMFKPSNQTPTIERPSTSMPTIV